MSRIERPETTEYAPYYAGYVNSVPDGDIVEILERQGRDLGALLADLPAARGDHRYAPGKWSVKEVVGHITDAERIFTCRALRISRGDATPLPTFDQDAYVQRGGFGRRSVADLAAEFSAVRAATIALLRAMTDEESRRAGTAGNNPVSARALAYIAAGHERHHAHILRERYLT
jgi:uncharacterized damage-inducible protein DinB